MKRAIVIGATSGIGRGLAECFAAQGYAVGLVGRRENLLKEIAQSDPAAYRFAVADVTRPAETVAALEHLAQELGGMDLCVGSGGAGSVGLHQNMVGKIATDYDAGALDRQHGGVSAARLHDGNGGAGSKSKCGQPGFQRRTAFHAKDPDTAAGRSSRQTADGRGISQGKR